MTTTTRERLEVLSTLAELERAVNAAMTAIVDELDAENVPKAVIARCLGVHRSTVMRRLDGYCLTESVKQFLGDGWAHCIEHAVQKALSRLEACQLVGGGRLGEQGIEVDRGLGISVSGECARH